MGFINELVGVQQIRLNGTIITLFYIKNMLILNERNASTPQMDEIIFEQILIYDYIYIYIPTWEPLLAIGNFLELTMSQGKKSAGCASIGDRYKPLFDT